MKKQCVNLHIDTKRTLIYLAFYSLFAILLNVLVVVSSNGSFAQAYVLLHSNYTYSVITNDSGQQDNYYRFNAGVYFALSAETDTSLDVDIVMQLKDSSYTDAVYWNTEELETNDIAISEGIARKYNLEIGDRLYSKHIVNGKVCEYLIKQILPEVEKVRVEKGAYTKGIIIMGYDNEYVNNISHTSIAFMNDSIDELLYEMPGTFENILYRDDELNAVYQQLLPYLLIFILLSVLITVILVWFLTKDIKHNFKRLVMLGFERNGLNRIYNRRIFSGYSVATIVAFCISVIVFSFAGACRIATEFLVLLIVIDSVAVFCSVFLLKRQLWGK